MMENRNQSARERPEKEGLDHVELARKIRDGNIRAASRLIRDLEDNVPQAKGTLKHIYPHTGKAHVIGITGSPGAGKSTITDELVSAFREKENKVAVLAVDPSSPFSGGAILGDRIRMQRHAGDPDVFIRSLATRGALGGLSGAVGSSVHILDAMGKDKILIETVGVGQQEVDVINHAHTVIVVLVPGMGDDIQAIKAGIMEVADIFVINKSHREGTRRLQKELLSLLDLKENRSGEWTPPVILVDDVLNKETFNGNIATLCQTIDAHHQHLISTRLLEKKLEKKAIVEIHEVLKSSILGPIIKELQASGEFDNMVSKVMKRQSDPYTLVEDVRSAFIRSQKGGE